MNKYERNIRQIHDKGESAEMYFLDKTDEECIELVEEIGTIKAMINRGMSLADIKSTTYFKNFHKELVDVMNCVNYLHNLFEIDFDESIELMQEKQDIGYERLKYEQ